MINKLLFFFILITNVSYAQVDYGAEVDFSQGPIKDSIYNSYLHSVLLYPKSGIENENITPPVIHKNIDTPLLLEFDEFGEENYGYSVKLIHCNADWTKSQLNEIEYLEQYNEFPITYYRASFNTRINYVHYEFEVPKVKIPGNYILAMYYQDEPNIIALTRKFNIIDPGVTITVDQRLTAGTGAATGKQLINFEIDYHDYPLINPMDNVKVYVRKNQRNNFVRKLEPTFINEGSKNLKFSNITDKYAFPGGNEFRKVDIRSTQFVGFNVRKVQNQDSLFQLSTKRDEFQISKQYRFYEDVNGQYIIDHYEYGDGEVQADYVKLFFQVESPFAQVGDVYVFGAMTDWKVDPNFKMEYYPPGQYYWANVKLKQGYYNYKYIIKRPEGRIDELFLDGDFYDTENQYEIFVYYRPIGQREDLLIGYSKFNFNKRN